MKNLFLEFISSYGAGILYTIVTGIASYIGVKIEKIYKEHINNKTKKQVVEDTVKYVEQIYKDLNGEEKLEKAKEAIIEWLNEKGIFITELEMNILIESTCNSFKSKK